MNRHERGAAPLYYGWVIAATLAVTETISWGIVYYAFTVFIAPMEAELGWSRGQLTGGFSLALLAMAATAFPVGAWIDKRGPRLLMTVGSILASLLVIAWSRVTDLTHFYLIWAALGACAAAILYEPAFTVIAAWFVRARGRALALITFAAGLASTIFVPLSDVLLNAVGWRDAVLILGLFLAAATILPHALILRRRPADLGLHPDGEAGPSTRSTRPPVNISLGDALRGRFFWMLTLAFSLYALAAAAVRVHFIPLLIDAGINASAAAFASGFIGVMQVAGRLVFVPLERRFAAHTMLTGVFAMQAAAMSVLLIGITWPVIVIFLIVFGSSYGAVTLVRAAAIGAFFGASHYGRISSAMSIPLTLAGTAAPAAAGLLYDRLGHYGPMLWGAALLALAAALVIARVRPDEASTSPAPAALESGQPAHER
jgi:MFS family permease